MQLYSPARCFAPCSHNTLRRNARNASSQRIARSCRTRCLTIRMQDQVLRSVSDNGEVSVLVVQGTDLVSEAARRHKTSPTASAALGRALLGTLLIGCFKGEDEKTQVTFQGDGPLGSVQVIADPKGNVKGKVGNPQADPPLRPDGKLNVGAAVGKGVLAVVRSHPLQEVPYSGMVPIYSGEIADDLARYLVDSEQTNSALGLGVSINKDTSVRAAGGFLIQVLPFASEETLAQLEGNLAGLPSMTEMLHEGLTPKQITERLLNGLGAADDGFCVSPKFGPCEASDLKERMKRAVALLGESEVKDIMEKEGKIEVTCEFCADTYCFQEEEILELIAQKV